jgi:hypothetical protein
LARSRAEEIYNWPLIAKNIECAYKVGFGMHRVENQCLIDKQKELHEQK